MTPPVAPEFVSVFTPMRAVLGAVERSAPGDSPVLISGDSGTGKRHLARLIHHWSQRAGGLVFVDCLAFGERSLECEIFGVDRGGVFPSPATNRGAIDAATGGTLVLDGIAGAPLELQAKLLRALEHRLLSRGAAAPRLVCVANRSLRGAVERGEFKEALREQIATIAVELPPLVDRAVDIAPLAEHFHRRFAGERARGFTAEGLLALESHDWPGNVRELRNVVERAATAVAGRPISSQDLSLRVSRSGPAAGSAITLDALSRAHIEAVLRQTNWHQGRAVELLGISPKTLYRKIREFGLSRPRSHGVPASRASEQDAPSPHSEL